MELPDSIATGRVTGRFIVGFADGTDAGDAPDVVPAEGTVTFTPSVTYLPTAAGVPDPVTILPAPIVAMLDYEGYLCAPADDGVLGGRRGVRLIATDNTAGAVQNWTWSVSYALNGGGQKSFPVPTHSMSLPAGSVVDLTSVVKIPSSPGVGTEQAIALIAVAQEAADAAATAALAAAESAAAAAAAAQANDQGVSGLVNAPASLTRQAVQAIVDAATGLKLSITTAAATYLTKAGLDAAAAAEVREPGTELYVAVTGRAEAAVPPAVATYLANDPSVVNSAATAAQNTAGIILPVKPDTAYAAGARAVSPDGDFVSAKVAFTTGAGGYVAADWNASKQGATKSVRLEAGKWVWDSTAATHYVIPDHTGALIARPTLHPTPDATPSLTW